MAGGRSAAAVGMAHSPSGVLRSSACLMTSARSGAVRCGRGHQRAVRARFFADLRPAMIFS
jgi:hypothetical protein